MKKKLALLMAAVMTIAAPVTAFAADPINGPGKVTNVPKNTLAVDSRVYNRSLTSTGNANVIAKDQDIDYIFAENGPFLMNVGDTKGYVQTRDTVGLTLDKAAFYYAEDISGGYLGVNGSNTTFIDASEGTFVEGAFSPERNKYQGIVSTQNNVHAYTHLYYTMFDSTSMPAGIKLMNNGTVVPFTDLVKTGAMQLTVEEYLKAYGVTNPATAMVDVTIKMSQMPLNSTLYLSPQATGVTIHATDITAGVTFDSATGLLTAGATTNATAAITAKVPLSVFLQITANKNLIAADNAGTIVSGQHMYDTSKKFHVGYKFTPQYDQSANRSSAALDFDVTHGGSNTLAVTGINVVTGPAAATGLLDQTNLKLPKTATDTDGLALSTTIATVDLKAASQPLVAAATALTDGTTIAYAAGSMPSYTLVYGGQIELPLAYRTTTGDMVKMIVNYNGAPGLKAAGGNGDDYELTSGLVDSGTTLTYNPSGVENARYATGIGTVNVKELSPGVINEGIFALQLNNNFVFDEVNPSIATDLSNWLSVEFLGYNDSKTTAYFRTSNVTRTVGTAGTIAISNLSVSYTGDKYYQDTMKAIISSYTINSTQKITFKDQSTGVMKTITSSGDAKVSAKNVSVATFENYGYTFRYNDTTQSATKIWAGRENITTPQLFFSEKATNSLWGARDLRFTLTDEAGNTLDGVKIAKVVLSDVEEMNYSGATEFSLNTQVGTTQYSEFNRSYIQVETMRKQTDIKKASLKVQFVLNVAANFEGNVYVTATGTAIDPNLDLKNVKIAEVKAPVLIETKSTPVSIGYQTYKTTDVKITEQATGLIRDGKTFGLMIDEFANTANTNTADVTFNPITSADVMMEKGTLAFNKISLGGNQISFAISKPSTKSTPAVFTVKNLAVKITRNVPYGSYDLIAGGTSIAETYKDMKVGEYEVSPYFPIKGVIFKDYVVIKTAGDTKTVAKNVVLTPGETKALVDGVEMKIEPAPFIDAESGRTLIPLRAASILLGIKDTTGIFWDPTTGVATIMVPSQVGQKVVTFTNDSSTMTVDGAPITMVDANGVAVKAQITADTNRMFIPLTQLGIAYGIETAWDGKNAIFNPDMATTATTTTTAN